MREYFEFPTHHYLTGHNSKIKDQLGLKIESRKRAVAVVVVDEAAKTPTAN
jgi:uncharacterized protein (TIGR03435 family)